MDKLFGKTQELLDRGKMIKAKESHYSAVTGDYTGVSGTESSVWINDVLVFSSQLPNNHPLKKEIERIYSHKERSSVFKQMYAILESLKNDNTLSERKFEMQRKDYDLFLSHANADKLSYVDDLYATLRKLGISVFYDKVELSWGDNWKQVILDGTNSSEFAIIVISENFFDREWTEKELQEFLARQNTSGQKIVLPLLHNITVDRLKEKYPSLGDIQVIDSNRYSKEEVAILFAKELIKRFR